MKPNYDNLTPAQKAKFTRLSNKLDEQRCAAFQIQWETYKKKSEALHAEIDPEVERISEEAQQKINQLRQQMKEVARESEAQIQKMREEVREQCKEEWEAYYTASKLANVWRAEKWEEAKANFWKELGYDITEEGKKTA